jgi:murein DD-endopeptidase MepM/ murein hydrolase activator NlpD
LLALAAGFYLGQRQVPLSSGIELTQQQQALHAQFSELNRTLATTRSGMDQQLSTLALRLGQSQAQVMRLEVLGESLVKQAHLDAEEFDFSNPPAQGGPADTATAAAPSLTQVEQALASLLRTLEDREHKLSQLDTILRTQTLRAATTPAGKPINGWISSPFGLRTDPFTGHTSVHNGVDLPGKTGTPVAAVAHGIVSFSGVKSGYGNIVELTHSEGYVTRYAHSQRNLVQEGDLVRKGQPVALLGSTGRSTGPHVHFEVLKDGEFVNPASFIAAIAADSKVKHQ